MKPEDILFTRKNGVPFTNANTLNQLLKKACKIAGINKKITTHSFRHAFITKVIKKAGIVTA